MLVNGEFKGLVIGMYEENHYDYSYFYAQVVDVEKGVINNVKYGEWPYTNGLGCDVDITYDNYCKYLDNARERLINEKVAEWTKQANTIEKGKDVEIVSGRKNPIGIVGKVFWTKVEEFGYRNHHSYTRRVKLGIKDSNGNVYWTWEDNCKVVNPSQYMPSVEEITNDLDEEIANSKANF